MTVGGSLALLLQLARCGEPGNPGVIPEIQNGVWVPTVPYGVYQSLPTRAIGEVISADQH
jgi:hypothetical protein